MTISGNTVLITGGATGIGYAMAEFFLEAGNEVIVCGRREEQKGAISKWISSLRNLWPR
ncbi:MAG TPA: SDR family NAD(P)-dependent oxidoreductase [Bacteroidota bacterium]